MASTSERFWAKVDKTPDCWNWTAAKDRKGYGYFGLGARGRGVQLAHRFAYELLAGPIPEGLVIDHLCRNTSCVNPTHLEPVTQGENVRRGVGPAVARWRRVGQTHCLRGHEYAVTGVEGGRKRSCSECRRIRQRQVA